MLPKKFLPLLHCGVIPASAFFDPVFKDFDWSDNEKEYCIDLAQYIKRFLRPRVRLGDIPVDLYGMRLTCGPIWEGPAVDTGYTFRLLRYISQGRKLEYEDVALIGFDPIQDRSLVIRQIQGVKFCGEDLKYFYWVNMLLQITIDWAKKYGFHQVKVVRAKHNPWYDKHKDEPELCGRLYRIYDFVPKKMGFRLDSEEKHYVFS